MNYLESRGERDFGSFLPGFRASDVMVISYTAYETSPPKV